jgi:hypothetical protein
MMEPHFHNPIRTDLDVAIDLAWHRARSAEDDPQIAERWWREHNELLRQRAEREARAS